jgi:hypothetical protein
MPCMVSAAMCLPARAWRRHRLHLRRFPLHAQRRRQTRRQGRHDRECHPCGTATPAATFPRPSSKTAISTSSTTRASPSASTPRPAEDVYRERVLIGARGGGKPFYASPVLIGDKLICVSRRDGAFIIAAKPKFELINSNVFSLDKSQFHGTPAVSGDQLILRSDKAVYCIGTK